MMDAKELHDALSANPTSGAEIAVLAAANMVTILRALSLLAAAEANDGTTPETDAAEIKVQLGSDYALTGNVPYADCARLERERNGLARSYSDALEENARLKERVALDDTEREYRRQSLANEIRETLKVRGHFAAERPSDLIGCVARAIESERERAERAEAELAETRRDLQFIERWANHHGQKPNITPREVLSMIQHYPPILEITRSYEDGKVPNTPNPWAELAKLRQHAEAMADELREPMALNDYRAAYPKEIDA